MDPDIFSNMESVKWQMICENNMEHTTSVNLQFRVPTFMMTHITFSHIRLDHEVQTSSTWAMDTSMMRMQQIVDHLSSIISKAPILAMSRDTFAFSIQAKTLLQTVDNIISKTSILAMSRNAFDAFQFNAIKYNAYQVFVCQYQYKCLQYINVQYTVGLY